MKKKKQAGVMDQVAMREFYRLSVARLPEYKAPVALDRKKILAALKLTLHRFYRYLHKGRMVKSAEGQRHLALDGWRIKKIFSCWLAGTDWKAREFVTP